MNKKENKEMSAVILAYDAETSVDQTVPIRMRYEKLKAVVVTDDKDSIEEAKTNRTALNALLKDASAPRLRVQRAIKSHPIGKFAFTKSQLEKDIEAAAAHLKLEIDAHEKPESIALANDPKDWMLVIRGINLAAINKLVGKLTDDGFAVENRGPIDYNA